MPVVLAFPEYQSQAAQLSQALQLDIDKIYLHRFPDGESKVTLPAKPASHVILCRSLDFPNQKLVELLLAASGLRAQGVERITLVAPYLCYMRQDNAFSPGEVVSQQIIGALLAERFDDVITVDAHLHRIHSLTEAITLDNAINVSAAALLGRFLTEKNMRPLLLGPDQESRQWVSSVAQAGGLDYTVAEKIRHGDCHVSIVLPAIDFSNQVVVIVDDVISSGHTIAETSKKIIEAGAREVHTLVTHALFAEGALQQLTDAGVRSIWSSDSISHESNVVELASLLGDAIRPLLQS